MSVWTILRVLREGLAVKKLAAHDLKWKIRNEKFLKIWGPIQTIGFLLFGIEEFRAGHTLTIVLISPIVMGLFFSIVGLIVKCQILEDKLQDLEARLK
jgi:hypothetical protein